MQFHTLIDSLPGVERSKRGQDLPFDVEEVEPRFCVCEMPEGDYPKVKLFTTVEAMGRFLGKREGDETSLWFFYGVPMRFTVKDEASGRRFLFLPGEDKVLLAPESDGEPVQILDAKLVDHMAWQDDGWVGPPELAEGGYYVEEPKTKKKKPDADDPEDDEDDDDEDEFEDQPID